MAIPLQTVQEMSAQARRGQTPALLERFLREAFPERSRSWLQQWLSGPLNYDVCKVDPFNDGGFFRERCVFWVFAVDRLLETIVVPSGPSFGLFSLGGDDGLRYLNCRRDHVEELLRAEGRPLQECDPLVLASLFSEALGRRGNSSHDVLRSQSHLSEYRSELGGFGGGYELAPREWARARGSLGPPEILGDPQQGWRISFCTVFGWMHDKQTLIRHQIRVAPDFCIQHAEEILSHRIFAKTPGVRY